MKYLGECVNHAVYVVAAHADEEGQREGPPIIRLGTGKMLFAVARSIIGLAMHRDVMHLAADTAFLELARDLTPALADLIEIDQDAVEMPRRMTP